LTDEEQRRLVEAAREFARSENERLLRRSNAEAIAKAAADARSWRRQ
jgi:hypothetical protein